MARAVVQEPHEPWRHAVRAEPRLPERAEQVSWDLAVGLGFGVFGRWLDLWVSRIDSAPVRHI